MESWEGYIRIYVKKLMLRVWTRDGIQVHRNEPSEFLIGVLSDYKLLTRTSLLWDIK
jgi:hypothetical protein